MIDADAGDRSGRVLGPASWMVLCLLLPSLLYVWTVRKPSPRWRAAYFANAPMEGAPVVREERDVNHDWSRREPPTEVAAGESFSARWDSCLALERAQAVAFQLTSDGGSRLFIDGVLVIDNRESDHGSQTQGVDVPVEAGLRHLRVEYRRAGGAASLTLLASLDGERPRSIDPVHLRFPRADAGRPCDEARQ